MAEFAQVWWIETEVCHDSTQGRSRRAFGGELGPANRVRIRGRRDRVQAQLLAIGVHHPHELDVEGIKDEPVVAAVASDEGNGRS